MTNIVNLHPERSAITVETPYELLERMTPLTHVADRAMVVLISDAGGVWTVDFKMASMSNAETIICLDIVKAAIMKQVMGG